MVNMKKLFALIICLMLSVSVFAKQYVYRYTNPKVSYPEDMSMSMQMKMEELIKEGYRIVCTSIFFGAGRMYNSYIIVYEDKE